MNIDNSKAYFEKAQEVIPGGVNSPVRACKSVQKLLMWTTMSLLISSAPGGP
jgi:glutamate-1-semialdehyde aminotransferase